MTKRNRNKIASLLLCAAMVLSLAPAAALYADADVSESSPAHNTHQEIQPWDNGDSIFVYPEESGEEDGSVPGLGEKELDYLEEYARLLQSPIGAVGFEEEYEPESEQAMVDVIVVLDTMPSAILPMYSRMNNLGITRHGAEEIAADAVALFTENLKAIDPKGRCTIKSTFTLFSCTVNMTVPASMTEQIAALDGVFAVTPDYIVTVSDPQVVTDAIGLSSDQAALFGGTSTSASEFNAQYAGAADTGVYAAGSTWNSLDENKDYADFAGLGLQDSRAVLGLTDLYRQGYTGKGITVGVLDSGVDFNHPDLENAYDFSNAGTSPRFDPSDSARGPSSSLGYDFVDNKNWPTETTYQMWLDSKKPEEDGGNFYYTTHGTHVASTIGGRGDNDSRYATLGIAPEVRLMSYRVLGPYGSGNSSVIGAAVERAYIDGCDVINMSLGGFTSAAFDPLAQIVNNAVLNGMMVVVSAGNSGPGEYTVGSPGISFLALTVGAAELGGFPALLYEQAVSYSQADAQTTPVPLAVEGYDPSLHFFEDGRIESPDLNYVADKGYEYVVCLGEDGGPTTFDDLAELGGANRNDKGWIRGSGGGNLVGKILVVKRGEMTFADIPAPLRWLGAAGIVIINRDGEEGYISNTLISGMKNGNILFLTTTNQAGAELVAAYQRAKDAGTPAYLQVGSRTNKAQIARLADFSSRGPLYNQTFLIKPDITAPGYRILAAVPAWSTSLTPQTPTQEDNKTAYILMDGTSMSAPHIAAIAAMMRQKYPDASPLEIKARLMNAVDPLEFSPSVYETGAGFVNVARALTDVDSYAVVADYYLNGVGSAQGPAPFASFSFGSSNRVDVNSGDMSSKVLPLTIFNTSDQEHRYTFHVEFNNDSPQFSLPAASNGVSLMVSENTVTISAKASATVNVNMFYPARANSGVYEGRLYVTNSETGRMMTLPFAGRIGPPLDGVSVENAWLSRPVITAERNGVADVVDYAANAHLTFDFTGRSGEQRVYVTNLNDEPIARGLKYNMTMAPELGRTFTLGWAIQSSMFLYEDGAYSMSLAPLPEGVYKLYLQVIPARHGYETQNVFVTKFVVDGNRPKLTVDDKVFEYTSGQGLTFTGNALSTAAALCQEHEIAFPGRAVIGQQSNALRVPGQVDLTGFDADGNFSVTMPSFTIDPASSTSVVTQEVYAVDIYGNWLISGGKSAWYGVNKSLSQPVRYTQTALVTGVTATNGTMTAALSNQPYNYTLADFAASYSADGGQTFRPLTLLDCTVTGEGASTVAEITFNPVRRTGEEQKIRIRLSYKNGTPFTADATLFTVAPSVAVYTDDSGADQRIQTEIVAADRPDAVAALARMPASGYISIDGVYTLVDIQWAWAPGVTYDGTAGGEYNTIGTISGTAPDGETIDGAIIIPRGADMPTITRQPIGVAVAQGGSATLQVTVQTPDVGQLSYQWYRSSDSSLDGAAIAGATNSIYAPSTATTGTQYYYVEVTNTYHGTTAAVTSDVAAVVVTVPVYTGSTGGESTAPGTPSIVVTTKDGGTTATFTAQPSTKTVDGVVTSTAKAIESTVADALGMAVAKQGAAAGAVAVQIKAEPAVNAQASALELPKGALATLARQKNAHLVADLGFAKVSFAAEALAAMAAAEGAGNVSVVVTKADTKALPQAAQTAVGNRPAVHVQVLCGGTQIANLKNGAVTVRLPYTPTTREAANPAAIVVYGIDRTGALQNVVGHYDASTGEVVFEAGRPEQYAVAFNLVSYPDTPSWAKDAATFAAARGIVSYDGIFDPDKEVTRAEFLMALMKAYAIDISNPKDAYAFADVERDSPLYPYAAVARELGITDGSDAARNLFRPDMIVDRQQIAAFFLKALEAMDRVPAVDTGRTLADYTDGNEVAPWAVSYVELAIKTGLINSTSNLTFSVSPTRMATRSQMVQLIYNLFREAV